ncbi:MAG: YbbR-like domain-containing protein [Flavobacteriales bacterium]|nr:YbbR-like domain-containing protein [Flavobacteriales bacterium]
MATTANRNPILRLFQDDRKRSIFIFGLALSSVFWLLSKLSRTYIATVELPVRYENLAEDRIWTLGDAPRIILEVEGYGFDLIGYRYRNRDNLVLDFDRIDLRQRHNDSQRAFVQLSELRKTISDRLSGSVNVLSVYPDTLFFPFALRADKPLPVSIQHSIGFKTGFGATGDIVVDPPLVKVSGRQALMDTLRFASTELWKVDNVSDTLRATLSLDRLDCTLRFAPSQVEVMLPVEEFTEVEYSIPISVIGLPDSLGLRLFPSTVKAICRVPLSRFEELSSDDFTAIVEFEQVKSTTGDRVRPNWTLVPDAAQLVRTDPERVEFLILKQ